MPVSKFRFVSPGVQTAEIDNSQLPRLPEEIGPVIIGRAVSGPLMRPVRIQSFSDFVDVFGEPSAGGVVGDVWRDGNRLAPTYGAYAAQAYLRNSSPITYVRLGGFQVDNANNTEKAGWESGEAYGLFVAPITGTANTGPWRVDGTASLAAVLYTDTNKLGLTGKSLTGSVDDIFNKTQTWVRIDDINCAARLVVNNDQTLSFNFNKDSNKYIRKVLNTNPVAFDSSEANRKVYFLGESYASHLDKNGDLTPDADEAQSRAVILLKLKGYQTFKQGATVAESGWVISQHLGTTGSYVANNGDYPMQKLFKLVSLTEGEWPSQNLKISIEEISLPANEYTKYGTFTVRVRDMANNDISPVGEVFTGLTLDPSSENYIAKRIGDKYTQWDYDKQAYTELGTYNNVSKYIRVQMNEEVDRGLAEPSLIPFGFYGPVKYVDSPVVQGSGSGVSAGTFYVLSDNYITGAGALGQFTASFAFPDLPILSDYADSSVYGNSLSAVYWGLQTNLDGVTKMNEDIKDYIRVLPADFKTVSGSAQFMFSLDDVSGTLTGSGDSAVIKESDGAGWQQDNRYQNKSITANENGLGVKTLLKKFNKFTLPLVGGSDGVDVTKKDPFSNTILDNIDSYAYNSVKVAIESMADAEIVEANLAAMPGITNTGLNSQLIEKCELRGDAMAIVDLAGDYNPETKAVPSVDTVVQTIADYPNTSYGAAFFPWVLIRDNINNTSVWVPPSVAALGTFSSAQRSTELWFAPAGFNRGGLSNGAAGLTVLQTAMRLTSKNRDDLYEANINPIATFPAEGIVIFGQKTLQIGRAHV